MSVIDSIEFISAGAGSGKTFKLTEDLHHLLASGEIDPAKVIATTFTVKAATELRERVRQKLLKEGESHLACQMGESLIGTVNSVCGQLLERFSFEAGLSPELSVIDERESQHLFNMALESNLSLDVIRKMNSMAYRLGQDDWRANVQSIVKIARSNNIEHQQLITMGNSSVQSLLKFFPHKVTRDLNQLLIKVIEEAINNIDGKQKNTKAYLRFIYEVKNKLKLNNLPWSQWVKLTKMAPAVAFHDYSDAVAQVAMDYEKHPQLHADIKDYTESLFIIASESINSFQTYKAKRGLIDFADQEQLLLSTLEDNSVQERLSDELDLLMVDEFQDTSPIQLALFLKLAECSGKVIFVGDIKQSIYGFRGSDPSLMFAVVDAIKNEGGFINILEDSWRSCRDLVLYTNAVFTTTFENTLKPEQVELNPQRTNIENENVVEHWQLNGSNIKKRGHALAAAVTSHVASKRKICNKEDNINREISFGDISILTRSNDNVDAIAAVLAEHQIPVQKVQTNLIGTPEASLVIACIRRLIDEKDTLASAEILSLSESLEPEVWLQDRLEFLDSLKNKTSQANGSQWANGSPIINQLNLLRESIKFYTPVEIVEHIIIDLHLRSLINRWGSDQQHCIQRLNNLDALMTLSQDYENYCQSSGDSATLSGLLIWWSQQSEEGVDEQAMVSDQDAVHIMTYHKAKGLEWPVVILMDLNKEARTRIWSEKMITPDTALDINDPLKGRSIQFWPWPFGQQQAGIPVKDKIDESDLGIQAYKDAVEEEKRLLYVAMTRARDELILTTDKNPEIKPNGWLSLTGTDWLLPKSDNLQLPDDYSQLHGETSQKVITIRTASYEYEATEPKLNRVDFKPQWFNEYPQYTDKLIESISPSSAEILAEATVGELISIGERISITGTPEMAEVGNAVHAVIATKCINPGYSQADTEQLLDSLDMKRHIKATDLLNVSGNLINYINVTYPNAKLYAEYPIQQVLDNGQIIKGWIDLLIETKKGWIICDHKSSPKKLGQLKDVAKGYSGQLKRYASAIKEISDKPIVGTIIHFPVSGNIAPVLLNRTSNLADGSQEIKYKEYE